MPGLLVHWPQDGDTRGNFLRLVRWADPAGNDGLAVNQFFVIGPPRTRRPDTVLFANGQGEAWA